MKQEYAEKWVKALRSGKYKQTKGSLRSSDGYCCLGVLCDIVKDKLNLEWEKSNELFLFDKNNAFLPLIVVQLTDIKSNTGSYDIIESSLSLKNDNGESFSKIADIIEKYQAEL